MCHILFAEENAKSNTWILFINHFIGLCCAVLGPIGPCPGRWLSRQAAACADQRLRLSPSRSLRSCISSLFSVGSFWEYLWMIFSCRIPSWGFPEMLLLRAERFDCLYAVEWCGWKSSRWKNISNTKQQRLKIHIKSTHRTNTTETRLVNKKLSIPLRYPWCPPAVKAIRISYLPGPMPNLAFKKSP